MGNSAYFVKSTPPRGQGGGGGGGEYTVSLVLAANFLFVSDLVQNPEYKFCRHEAHVVFHIENTGHSDATARWQPLLN